MKKVLFLFLIIGWITNTSTAQKNKALTGDARFAFRPMIFIDYSLYHWYQEPSRQLDKTPKNMGQVANVLPGLGAGFIMGKKTTLLFSVEASIKYFPFSLDVAGYEGMGAISFPVLANVRFPVGGFLFGQIGGGVQWSQINIHNQTKSYEAAANPFFMTYVGELGIGAEENIYILYFLRFGYNTNQATTFDFGLRIGLHGNLWD